MKNTILIVSCLFLSLLATGQTDTLSTNILEKIMRLEQPAHTIYYTDQLHSEWISGIKDRLKSQRLVGYTGFAGRKELYLTKDEKKHIDSCLVNLSAHLWEDSLFGNSKRISKDSMWGHIRKRREIYEKARSAARQFDTTVTMDNTIEQANVFQFSPPIFIRNNSICIVSFVRLCGSECGVHELTVYRFQNGQYERWLFLDGGAF